MVKNLFLNLAVTIPLKKSDIHNIVKSINMKLSTKIESLTINFVNEEDIIRINIDYLNHHYSTDIITFNYTGNNEILNGEIFICPEEAGKNSKKYKVTLENELKRLVIHGILHLIGYDDLTSVQKRQMRMKENELLKYLEMYDN